jgi:hypothetical protein
MIIAATMFGVGCLIWLQSLPWLIYLTHGHQNKTATAASKGFASGISPTSDSVKAYVLEATLSHASTGLGYGLLVPLDVHNLARRTHESGN